MAVLEDFKIFSTKSGGERPLLKQALKSSLAILLLGLQCDFPLAFAGISACDFLLGAASTNTSEQSFATIREKYPGLDFILKDPDAFVAVTETKFNNQRVLDPAHPYHFEYDEVGRPLLKKILEFLDGKMTEITQNRNLWIHLPRFLRHWQPSEINLYLDHLASLRADTELLLKNDHFYYDDVIANTFFYSRAIGQFDTLHHDNISQLFLWIDRRFVNGYRQIELRQEVELYKRGSFRVFENYKASQGFTEAQMPFEKGFSNPRELEEIWVPSVQALDGDIFMRLMFKKIHLVGITYGPVLADGILRPGGDFWNHDVRHESGKYHRKQVYVKEHSLNDTQLKQMDLKIQEWLNQLEEELLVLESPELGAAISYLSFNVHHDRGYPLIPSVYLSLKNPQVLAYPTYYFQKFSGEGVLFSKPQRTLSQANSWLRNFWSKRLQEEVRILDRNKPVPLKSLF